MSFVLTYSLGSTPVPGAAGSSSAASGAVAKQASDFREYIAQQSPGFLRQRWGARFMGLIGLSSDTIAEGAQQAVAARFTRSPIFPPDAYELIGAERSMPRFPSETLAAYRERVLDAWNAWRNAGTEIGLIDQLSYFPVTAEVYANADWDWDSDSENWSRFWVVLTDHGWTDDGAWGDPGIWGDGGTWGSSASLEEVRSIQALIRQWKPGHMVCVHVVVVLDENAWSPTPSGDWDRMENRSDAAIYWPG